MKHCRVSVFLNNTLCRNLTFDTFPAVLVTPLAQPRSVLEVGKLGILESPSLWETSPGGKRCCCRAADSDCSQNFR